MKKISRNIIIIGVIFLLSFMVQQFSGYLYPVPVARIDQIEIEADSQKITTSLINDEQKKVHFTEPLDMYGAITPAYRKGDQLIVAKENSWEIRSLKRDGLVFFLLSLFVTVTGMIGKKRGIYGLVGVSLNLLFLLLVMKLNQTQRQIPFLLLMSCYSFLAVLISMAGGYREEKIDKRKVVATLMSVFGAFFICFFAMDLLQDQGLRYEEMQFVTRPYRSVFLAGLLIGAIGAALDNVVMIISSMDELKRQNPELSKKELLESGRAVALDTSSSMVTVLLFAYLSSAIPSLIFYLANGWSFQETLHMHLSLEILRALCGGFALLLSVPSSLGIVELTERWDSRRRT